MVSLQYLRTTQMGLQLFCDNTNLLQVLPESKNFTIRYHNSIVLKQDDKQSIALDVYSSWSEEKVVELISMLPYFKVTGSYDLTQFTLTSDGIDEHTPYVYRVVVEVIAIEIKV